MAEALSCCIGSPEIMRTTAVGAEGGGGGGQCGVAVGRHSGTLGSVRGRCGCDAWPEGSARHRASAAGNRDLWTEDLRVEPRSLFRVAPVLYPPPPPPLRPLRAQHVLGFGGNNTECCSEKGTVLAKGGTDTCGHAVRTHRSLCPVSGRGMQRSPGDPGQQITVTTRVGWPGPSPAGPSRPRRCSRSGR